MHLEKNLKTLKKVPLSRKCPKKIPFFYYGNPQTTFTKTLPEGNGILYYITYYIHMLYDIYLY